MPRPPRLMLPIIRLKSLDLAQHRSGVKQEIAAVPHILRHHHDLVRRSTALPRSVAAGLMSVCAKSSPLNSNGSPVNFASAYAKQSPKFRQLGRMAAAFAEIAIGVACNSSLGFGHGLNDDLRLFDQVVEPPAGHGVTARVYDDRGFHEIGG